MKSSAPQRAAASAAFLARECRQDLDLLHRLKLTEDDMRAQLTREKQNLERTSASTRPLPASPQDPNSAVCK